MEAKIRAQIEENYPLRDCRLGFFNDNGLLVVSVRRKGRYCPVANEELAKLASLKLPGVKEMSYSQEEQCLKISMLRSGRTSTPREAVRKLQQEYKLPASSYARVMEDYVSSGEYAKALEVYRTMLCEDVIPTPDILKLVGACGEYMLM